MKKCVILYLLSFPCLLSAQSGHMTYGMIPAADLQATAYEKDTSAEAVVLGDLCAITVHSIDGGGYFYNRHRRIKLFKKSSIQNYGDVSIPYYHHEGRERINNIKAQVYSPSGKIRALDRKDFFYAKVSQYWTEVKFSFPMLEEGSIIEFQYDITSREVEEPRGWNFQERIPIRISELRFNNESRYSYVTLYQGGDYMEEVERKKDGTVVLAGGDARYTFSPGLYTMENAPALREEPYITTIEDYRHRIRFQLSEYYRHDGTKVQFLSSWEEVAKELPTLEFFGQQYTKKRYYKDLLAAAKPLIRPEQTMMEKVEAVYNFVNSQISWNGSMRYAPGRSLDEAFKAKAGSSAEINFMLLALLNEFGVPAYPVLTSSRDHGKMSALYPILRQFNYVLAMVENGNNLLLLDATDPLRPIGMPGLQSLNETGWVVNPEKPSWIKINVPPAQDLFAGSYTLDTEGNISGKMRAEFTSYSALGEREKYRSDQKGSYWEKRLEGFATEVKIESFDTKYFEQIKEKFINDLTFYLPAAATVSGDFLYVSPYVYSNFQENPFKSAERQYPVDFPCAFVEKYLANFVLPEGYTVEELPANTEFKLADGSGSFSYQIEDKGAKVLVLSQLTVEKTSISPEVYPQLKEMFDLYVQKMGEQLVLKKK